MSNKSDQTTSDDFPPEPRYANTNTVCMNEWKENDREMQEPIFFKWRFVAFDGQVCVVDLCQWNVGAEVQIQSTFSASNDPTFQGN